MWKVIFIALLSGSLSADIAVNLRNPIFQDGCLRTTEGGSLTSDDIRIQAQNIEFAQNDHLHCSCSVLIDYKCRTLVGESLEYNFATHTGVLTHGKTAAYPWFVGGDLITLCENGDLVIEGGYITTSECGEKEVLLKSEKILVTQDKIVTAQNIELRILQIPFFAWPYAKVDLKYTKEAPFSIIAGWNGFLGSHLGIKYHFLTLGPLKGYARIDGYFGHGVGFGIDTEYGNCFSTRNYYAHDLAINDPQKKDRYRFQGNFFQKYCPQNISISGVYDFVSDPSFAQDYQPDNFALNPAYRTELEIRRQSPFSISNLFTRVRVNSFQSINQELPTYELALNPFEIGQTQIISDNYVKMSYLHYVFSKNVIDRHNFHSARIEIRPRLYRAFHLNYFTLTPSCQLTAIAYSNSPEQRAVGLGLVDLSCRSETSLSRCFGNIRHGIMPYFDYHFLTTPTASLNSHFLFTIADAYHYLNILRFGLRQGFFYGSPLWIDLYANAFFEKTKVPTTIPKGYLNIQWQTTPFVFLETDTAWNFAHSQIDYFNQRINWTLSENLALSAEYRHRGRYDWRKNDFYNFLLDSVRPESELLDSPLSEKRDTILGKIFYRLTPDFAVRAEMKKGWGRLNQPPYLEYGLGFEKLLFQRWNFSFSYEKRTEDHRFTMALKLLTRTF